jgi:hypothetical protein
VRVLCRLSVAQRALEGFGLGASRSRETRFRALERQCFRLGARCRFDSRRLVSRLACFQLLSRTLFGFSTKPGPVRCGAIDFGLPLGALRKLGLRGAQFLRSARCGIIGGYPCEGGSFRLALHVRTCARLLRGFRLRVCTLACRISRALLELATGKRLLAQRSFRFLCGFRGRRSGEVPFRTLTQIALQALFRGGPFLCGCERGFFHGLAGACSLGSLVLGARACRCFLAGCGFRSDPFASEYLGARFCFLSRACLLGGTRIRFRSRLRGRDCRTVSLDTVVRLALECCFCRGTVVLGCERRLFGGLAQPRRCSGLVLGCGTFACLLRGGRLRGGAFRRGSFGALLDLLPSAGFQRRTGVRFFTRLRRYRRRAICFQTLRCFALEACFCHGAFAGGIGSRFLGCLAGPRSFGGVGFGLRTRVCFLSGTRVARGTRQRGSCELSLGVCPRKRSFSCASFGLGATPGLSRELAFNRLAITCRFAGGEIGRNA